MKFFDCWFRAVLCVGVCCFRAIWLTLVYVNFHWGDGKGTWGLRVTWLPSQGRQSRCSRCLRAVSQYNLIFYYKQAIIFQFPLPMNNWYADPVCFPMRRIWGINVLGTTGFVTDWSGAYASQTGRLGRVFPSVAWFLLVGDWWISNGQGGILTTLRDGNSVL